MLLVPVQRVVSGRTSSIKPFPYQMWTIDQIFLLDQLRPGLSAAVNGNVDQQDASGNYAAVGKRRRREGRHVRRQQEGGRVAVWM